MGLALRFRRCAGLAQLLLDRFHRHLKVLIKPGPARRVYAGRALERIDHQAGIVGKGRQPGRLCGRFGLDPRIGAKARSAFVGFVQAHLAC